MPKHRVRLVHCAIPSGHQRCRMHTKPFSTAAAATHNTNLSFAVFHSDFFKQRIIRQFILNLLAAAFLLSVKCNTPIRFKLFLNVIQTVGGSDGFFKPCVLLDWMKSDDFFPLLLLFCFNFSNNHTSPHTE